ncbi:hypothetical protein D9757_005535 [Collybiopsis confluens]|uniref:Uncharacterized protein n=1 Tax=Collybiopsis confluens TaxID=2823264 RepID=A0A8H5HLL5_9AGAR|nr:hypothetical protein D9757_005535 [Collybiopsis confluens]
MASYPHLDIALPLRRCQCTELIQSTFVFTSTSSAPLPLYRSVQHNPVSPQTGSTLKHWVVLIAFAHTWLTLLHLFTIVSSGHTNACDGHTDNDIPTMTWAAIAVMTFATILLVLAFGHCLLAFGIKQDFERWGHFLHLYRVVSFILSSWFLLLWIIDLFEGRIEIVRR